MSHNKKSNSIMVRYCLTFLIYSEVERKMDEPTVTYNFIEIHNAPSFQR